MQSSGRRSASSRPRLLGLTQPPARPALHGLTQTRVRKGVQSTPHIHTYTPHGHTYKDTCERTHTCVQTPTHSHVRQAGTHAN